MNILFLLIDYLFTFVLFFLFNLIWCTYFFNGLTTRFIISTAISLFCCLTIYLIHKSRYKALQISKKEKNHIKDVLATLQYMPNKNLLNFFYKLCLSKHECTLASNYIIIKNNDKNIILYPCFNGDKISVCTFVDIIKDVKNLDIKRLVVLCAGYENKINLELDKFDFEIIFLKNEEIYFKLLKKYEFFPEITIKNTKKPKNTLKFLTSSALNKKRTKGYLLSALCLFVASFFNAYKIYYVAISSLLVVLAIFCRFNAKFNTNKEINLLD